MNICRLIVIVLGLCAVIVFAGWLRSNSFLYMLEVGISLAIAAVPEGLRRERCNMQSGHLRGICCCQGRLS